MRTLFVSDLDGTLLHSDETTSAFTNSVINRLTAEGMRFSYATARSFVTAKKVTKGLTASIPLIVYNGALMIDNATERIYSTCFFGSDVRCVLDELFRHSVYPIVYAFIDGAEKFSYVPQLCTRGMRTFLESRRGDIRTNAVDTPDALRTGELFYLSCIDEPEKLEPLWLKFREQYHCVYQRDIYSGEQWLEIMPREATKARAVKRLQTALGCERLVVFGDGKNDIDLFQAADEAYAVQNADPELKQYADAVIASNNEDGVARWLISHYADYR